ncbi:Maf family protein [Thiomicrorhabdus aquaedulcis]|uniref:Maf family protein n=1 Tax=Thiomicrorhabdus aquaedulcis TaxID=2211106 RepID=UPI001E353571|nr:nucleoside triphosphate pyrophosphatase [Thiomicrorhabdus aquaedulcis]
MSITNPQPPNNPLHKTLSGNMPNIVLGSSSIFRKQLLSKLHLNFVQASPNINETPLPNETPNAMVMRLSLQKAQALTQDFSHHIIIASDQCAVFNDQAIGKPHTPENAFAQLKQFSGQVITFYTGLVVINTHTQQTFQALDQTDVHFRHLSDSVIHNYIALEQPLNCAGSFKSEGLGITLFSAINSTDPNALIGLPLIELTSIFLKMGYELPYLYNAAP